MKSTRLLPFLLLPLAALALLRSARPTSQEAPAPVTAAQIRAFLGAGPRPAPRYLRPHPGPRMPNPQVTTGGSAVGVPITSPGNNGVTGSTVTTAGHFKVETSAGTTVIADQAIPAVGSPLTSANLVITNLNSTTTVVANGGVYPNLSVTALSGAATGTNFTLKQAANGGGNPGFSFFDVLAGAPAARSAPYFYGADTTSTGPRGVGAVPWAQTPTLADGNTATGPAGVTGVNPVEFVLFGPGAPAASVQVSFRQDTGSSKSYDFVFWGSNDGLSWTDLAQSLGTAPSGSVTTLSVALDGGAGTTNYSYAYYQAVLTHGGVIALEEFSMKNAAGTALPSQIILYPAQSLRAALLSGAGVRAGVSFAARQASAPVIGGGNGRVPSAFGAQTGQAALLGASIFRLPGSWSRLAGAALLSGLALRGPVHGTSTVPVAASASLFGASASRGVLSASTRLGKAALFSPGLGRGNAGWGARTAGAALFSALAKGGTVAPALGSSSVDPRDPFVVLMTELRYLLTLKGNPVSTASVLLAITDRLAASYRTTEINLTANSLASLPELIRGGDGTTGHTTYGFGADQPILTLLPAAENMIAAASPDVVQTGIYSGFVSSLQSEAVKLGYTGFDAYATSVNTSARFSFLVHPNFALLYWLYRSKLAGSLLSPSNVFAPQTTLGTLTVGAGAGAVTFTHVNDVPTVNAPTQQGYTPAPNGQSLVTTTINGTLTITITGSGIDSGGVARTGRTWTCVLSSVAANAAPVNWTPTIAGDRIASVTGVTGSGTATAGAVTLLTQLERIVS